MRIAACLVVAMLAACRPAATDDYVERVALDEARTQQRAPIASPDVEGAIWAIVGAGRLVYGKPGAAPLFALACEVEGRMSLLRMTRFAATDRDAKALMALVGNGHIARLKIDSEWNGRAWLWEGRYAPADPRLDVLTGPRKVEVTVPGAGTLELTPSPLPAELIEGCRQLAAPEEEQPEPPDAEPLPPA